MLMKMWKPIKNFFIESWHIKLLALVIAVTVWFYAGSRLKEEVVVRVPVNIQTPEGYTLLYLSQRHVRLRFSGPQHLVTRRQEEARQNYLQYNVRLETEDLEERDIISLDVEPAFLNISESELMLMDVVIVEPEEIEIFTSRIIQKTLPVEASFSGTPRGGFKITDYTVTPSEVNVSGPQIVLDQLSALKTHTIPVWDAQESFRRYVPLIKEHSFDFNDAEIAVTCETAPSQVAVHISVEMEHASNEIEEVPVKLLTPLGFPYQASIPTEEAYVKIVVSGPPDTVRDLTAPDISAYVDLSDFENEDIPAGTTSPYKQSVEVLLRPGMDAEIQEIVPEQVTILLEN